MNKSIPVKLLSLILSLALIVTAFPVAFAAKNNDTFSVVTMNDIHYYPSSLAGDKQEAFYTYLQGHNCVYDDLDAIVDAALESLEYEVKNNGVKHIVLVGDLTTNGEYEGHLALREKLLAFEKKTGADIYVTAGNHDINNPRASSFVNNKKEEARTTSPAEFYEIYKELGFNDAYHQFTDFDAEIGGSLSYSVKTEDGYRLILADAGKFTPDVTESGIAKQETAGKLTPELLQWVLDEARDAKENGETPLLFTHWNMSGANYFHEFLMQGFVIDDAYMLQEILADAGINYTFSGHQHISDVAITYSDSGNPMYSVITPILTQFPFSYRMTEFTKNSKGGIDATFNQRSVDEYSAVRNISGNGSYPSPYRETGFFKQYGGHSDAADYVFNTVKSTLDKYIGGIRAEGSIVKYIEKEAGINIEELINSYLGGGIYYEGRLVLSGKNVMSFLDDLDVQLMEKYIYNKADTYALIRTALRNFLSVQISEYPCDSFIDAYGFGDTERGGTLGDAVLAIMATMYLGNEDISEDAFLTDVVEFSGTPEFLELLIDAIKKYIVDDLLVNNIFASVNLNLDTLFADSTESSGYYVQMIFMLLVAILDVADEISDFESALHAVVKALRNYKDISLKKIIEAVLGTGLIPYGSTIDELVDSLVDMFITEDTRAAAVYQAKIVIGGMVTDETKDFDVTYVNNGPVKVVPTKEDKQLPVNVTISPVNELSGGFTLNWITKYSVTGTDIKVYDENGDEVTGITVTADVYEDYYTAPGYDAGTFGLFPWSQKINRHSITVTGLEAGTTYNFTFGDMEKGFTDTGSITTAPSADEEFTFLHMSGEKGYVPAQFDDFAASLTNAASLYPAWGLIAYTGSLTGDASNEDLWSFATAAAEKYFTSKYTAYSADADDAEKGKLSLRYFPAGHTAKQQTYYSYNYGNAHFAVIDANDLTVLKTLSGTQLNWLKGDLLLSEMQWNVLVSGNIIYGENADTMMNSQISRLMEEYGIDIILQADEAVIRTADGIETVAIGDAAFNAITINGNKITVDTVDENGKKHTVTSAQLPWKVLAGDTDGNGIITAADARLALRISVGLEQPNERQLIAADADGDGKISASDARLILRASVGLGVL